MGKYKCKGIKRVNADRLTYKKRTIPIADHLADRPLANRGPFWEKNKISRWFCVKLKNDLWTVRPWGGDRLPLRENCPPHKLFEGRKMCLGALLVGSGD